MGNVKLSILIFLLCDFLLMLTCCKNDMDAPEGKSIEEKSVIAGTETYPLFVKFRSFQNSDSTWGYTVFVNSRPYIHYSRIAYKNEGFETKYDAELVAGILVKMIQNGEKSPKFNRKMIDSIDLVINDTK